MQINEEVAYRLNLPVKCVAAVVGLLDDGATVPFISRYRKEMTGGLDEVAIRDIELALKNVRDFVERREFIREAIANAGALTPDLASRLDQAVTLTEIEDIYAPYKPRKRSRAVRAREKGLELLAKIIMKGNVDDCLSAASRFVNGDTVATPEDAIAGAADIIAEWASDNSRLRNMVRNAYRRTGRIVCTPDKDKLYELDHSPYYMYGNFSQSLHRIASHQYLAMRRAESEGFIHVKYEIDDSAAPLDEALWNTYMPRNAGRECAAIIAGAVADSCRRLLRPSVENEISASLKADADRVAIDVFASNLRQLLMGSPLKGRRVLAIDPGFRTGCKVVALDEQGALLDDTVIYPTSPRDQKVEAASILGAFIEKYELDAVALGNGTASRDTERFLHDYRIMPPDSIFVVSEDGASVYSASDAARKEFPKKDVTVRGAISIGRRLIDPLAELVKIDPKSIGVGQYQHDVDQTELKNALDYTVMSCVNAVGVDVNTASEALLQYVSGIGPNLARNIVRHRVENGPFATRRDLLKVSRLGNKSYEQAAGFLRIPGGSEPLDNTGIHPESYHVVEAMARQLGVAVDELPGNGELLAGVDVDRLVAEGIAGYDTLYDIIHELEKPGRDPRQDNAGAFVPDIDSFDQLYLGMRIHGEVCNITAFGAFVYLGIKENGLLHISKIADRKLSSVSDVLHLGQIVEATVIEIDPRRGRIGLSML